MKKTFPLFKSLFIFYLTISLGELTAQTWESFGPLEGNSFNCMHVDTAHEVILIGTNEGFWYQDIGSGIWVNRIEEGWIGRAVWSIASHPLMDGRVITGRENAWFKGYMEYSDDWGATNNFVYESNGGSVYDVQFADANPEIVYAVTISDGPANGEFLKSTDGGVNWSSLASPHTFMTSIAVVPNSANSLFISGDALITKSTNGGLNWTSLSNGLPSGLGIYSVDINKADENSLICSNDNGLYRTTDGGENWIQVYGESCKHITYNLSLPNVVAAITFNTHKILLSLDNGENWINYTGNFPFSENLRDIAFSKDGTQLYCLSNQNIYESNLTILGVEKPKELNVEVVSIPNPFTDLVQLNFNNPKACRAKIAIVNVLGEEIDQIFNGFLQEGTSSFQWGSGEESGVYFCLISFENGTKQTLKLIKN